ncbi:hypothetical protein CFC21_096990 [Triticum aestivum]|uniref:RNA helicase n=3 Tax=Triticum TaxID=4564 RepID=A0A3B6RHL0_WHEAT|nr:hypothetical protein CFC21_096990 [Triticum aestivum]
MESPGGGAEARARSRQYDYGANSNLVVNTGSRPRDAHHEPTGEPQTLSGRIRARSFGDRAVRTRPPGLEEKRGRSRGKKARDAASADLPHRDAKRMRRGSVRPEDSVLSLAHDALYMPRTRETRTAYEALLSVIQRQLGGQPLDVLADAADEVLAALKDDRVWNPDKKKVIEKLINPVSDQMFGQLVSIGKLITDFHDAAGDSAGVPSADGTDMPLDDDIGITVEFEDDEDEESNIYQVQDELDDENEDDLVELNVPGTMQTDGELYDDDMQSCNKGLTLDVQDIDAYWLQRKISQAYENIDPQHSQKLAEEILKVIAEGDDRDVENRLVTLLDHENFDLIKLLLHNRLKIVWCTFLARAEDQEQRKKIAEEMMSDPRLAPILEQLHSTRASAKERQKNLERSIRDEAKRLLNNDSAGTDGARDSKAVDRYIESGWLKGQRQLLDLDNLSFHQGSLLMSNKKCELPPGSFRTPQRGYEEVHVPALRPLPYESAERIVKISDMPEWARPAFAGMTQLNRVQSKVYDTALYKPDNILLCAPTGAGKTNVAVLTILQQIGLHMKDGEFDNTKYKIVYVAPMKALVAEVVGNLSARLKEYNVTVSELSGDQNLTKQQIDETQIIVTTPEKWDIVTRKSSDRIYTQMVKLLIIDEIHLLHDNRGPVLESIVSRTVRQIETTKEHIRLVGLSATLPNYEDIAVFLRVRSDGLFHFDNSYRPCPLAQQYIGITAKKPLQRFQLMNEICYEKVMAAAGKHQVLIFVHSRKETAQTARAIRDTALANDVLPRFLKDDSASQEILCAHAELVKSSDLKDLLPYGFAIHHAGLARVDRELVEKLFVDKHIQVLISIATLAWGVNLPAHTVIIKGTQIYNSEKGAWTELSPLDVMQMLGRAGRPQYDTHGEGIILTSHSELQYYLSLMNQQLPIESQFISKLADQLNAEIVLGTIQNAQEACSERTLDERRADLVHSAANLLDRNNLIKYDKRTGYFQATDLGRISSYYYISHRTISTYNEYLKPTMGYIELCQLFSLSEEFKYVSVRKDEKMELEKLLDRVPIPVKESLEEPSTKINVLLQAYISGLKLEGLSLGSDMVYIKQSAGRLSRAIFEIVLKRGWSQLAEKALNLCTMIDKQMWSVQNPLRQFPGIPNEILMKLEKKELAWERYFDLSSQEIGELIRYPKMGRRLHQCIHQLPKLNLSAHVQPITRTVLGFELTLTADFQWDDKIHGYVEPFWILVEDNDSECILHHEYFMLKKQWLNEDHTLNFTVPIYEPLPPLYFIHVVSDKWLGSWTILPVSFRHLVLPDKHAPPTELLDLQPLPVTALRNARYEGLYSAWKHFNPIQTQVFSVLYNSDDSVLVAAPTGSGKTICAEFAILRNHQKAVSGENNMRIVYIAPIEALAKERYRDWEMKFGEFACVVELTGETARDLKLLDKGEIIISTPEKWDSLSRRWKQRKHIQQVSLFIVDELHLIGSEKGHVLDIIVSRMRRIANHTCSNIRIVALSASLANAKDLGEWIGATSHGLFNFPPAVRPVPSEIHIQGMDIANFEARMQAMAKPTYNAIRQYAKHGKPALVFVPATKHARFTALNLCTYSNAEGCGTPFLLGSEDEMDTYTRCVNEETLVNTLKCGVGYLHEALSDLDQEVVTQLFLCGKIQVCVVSSTMCWGRSLPSHLVVVMGTQYSDGWGSVTDYPVSDLLQMMGHASRPLQDNSGKCVILCHAPRKEYHRKFLSEAFPVESHLHHNLHDHMNAEVVCGVVENKQAAVDYLTWTFMHVSDHLSELVETVLDDLESSKCVVIEEDTFLKPLNLGLIASYYYISYKTIERFSSMITQKTKIKGLLEILASASEYAELPSCRGEEESIETLVRHQRFSAENSKNDDVHIKANALLQAHFSRQTVVGNLAADQREILLPAPRLIKSLVDAMELSQMVTQGMWDRDSVLLQLPHFTKELTGRCQENGIDNIFDLAEMSADKMQNLLQLPNSQLKDIIGFIKRFPDIEMAYEVLEGDDIRASGNVTLQVTLERDMTNLPSEVGPVNAPRYPKPRQEGWWLVIGDSSSDQLLAIKWVAVLQRARLKLEFIAPAEAGKKDFMVFLMSDSYLGIDQEYVFTVNVKDAGGD